MDPFRCALVASIFLLYMALLFAIAFWRRPDQRVSIRACGVWVYSLVARGLVAPPVATFFARQAWLRAAVGISCPFYFGPPGSSLFLFLWRLMRA